MRFVLSCIVLCALAACERDNRTVVGESAPTGAMSAIEVPDGAYSGTETLALTSLSESEVNTLPVLPAGIASEVVHLTPDGVTFEAGKKVQVTLARTLPGPCDDEATVLFMANLESAAWTRTDIVATCTDDAFIFEVEHFSLYVVRLRSAPGQEPEAPTAATAPVSTCGDGILQSETERCDGSDCPTDVAVCDDGNACTIEVIVGRADTCTAECRSTPITACADDDGCCVVGCGHAEDNDCPLDCENGVQDAGEEGVDCGGSCPTACIPPCDPNDPSCCYVDDDCESGSFCFYDAYDNACASDPTQHGECKLVGELDPSKLNYTRYACGCDGVTYQNNYLARNAGVNVATRYEPCAADLPEGRCLSNADCSSDTFCQFDVWRDACNAGGTTVGTCAPYPGLCLANYDPVCGCDGETYGNSCEAQVAQVSAAYEGECRSRGACSADGDCNFDEFCKFEPTGNACGVDATQQGYCEVIPDSCPNGFYYADVCGCDGTTYSSRCRADAAGVNVAYVGSCPAASQ